MGVSVYPVASSAGGASVPNWQLLQTATPSGVATITFSGLANYARYRILIPNLICTTSLAWLELRMNADTGANYSDSCLIGQAAATVGLSHIANNFITLSALQWTAGNPMSFTLDIDHALLLAPKYLSGNGMTSPGGSPYPMSQYSGWYYTTSALTSITLLLSVNNFSTGSIYLLGAN